jgi:hypothetical protein
LLAAVTFSSARTLRLTGSSALAEMLYLLPLRAISPVMTVLML